VCHQTVSLIARFLEAQGIPTLCLASAFDIIEAGNPPRVVFLDYPLGHAAGKPFDHENQRLVLRDALDAFEAIGEPGSIVRLRYRWSDSDNWKSQIGNPSGNDVRAPRGTEPVYQTEADRKAAERSSGAHSPT
jgi:D-proline reductase (dithiol) PrdB